MDWPVSLHVSLHVRASSASRTPHLENGVCVEKQTKDCGGARAFEKAQKKAGAGEQLRSAGASHQYLVLLEYQLQ